MRKYFWLSFPATILLTFCKAQTLEKAAKDAQLISRMAEKYHVQPKPLDASLSTTMYDQLLEYLDPQRFLFTTADLAKLSVYRTTLHQQVATSQTSFLQLLIGIYTERIRLANAYADTICAKPFNFQLKEKYTAAEDTSYPANQQAMRLKIYKLLKLMVLTKMIDAAGDSLVMPSQKKIDSLEPGFRKKANHTLKRFAERMLQSPRGINYVVGNIYCQALATSYDPHTAYFPPDIKTAFESQLGNNTLEYGLSVEEDESGNPEIGRLKPGSPAFKSGQINEGDKIQSIQWEGKNPIDVSDAPAKEIERLLGASGGKQVTLTFKKADGTTRQVVLQKEKMENDDEDSKVKSYVLKGDRTVGFISLPDFYNDWENASGVNGCANDIAKEILKLKKENIQGLVLDLRYNGGGSMQEAVELAGIFIDAGPVAQIVTRNQKSFTLKDVNRGTIFDGPLVVLVNGSSASASEMVAGTLQDYHRATIIGSPTYGKATAQVVLPMDTTINLDNYKGDKEAESYIKLTISKLYRVSGNTAQVKGVLPDIQLPDPGDANGERESGEKTALQVQPIPANKYYQPLPALPIESENQIAQKEVSNSDYFKLVRKYTELVKTSAHKDVSLELKDAFAKTEEEKQLNEISSANKTAKEKSPYTVTHHAFDLKRIESDADLKEIDEEARKLLESDPALRIAWSVLTGTTK